MYRLPLTKQCKSSSINKKCWSSSNYKIIETILAGCTRMIKFFRFLILLQTYYISLPREQPTNLSLPTVLKLGCDKNQIFILFRGALNVCVDGFQPKTMSLPNNVRLSWAVTFTPDLYMERFRNCILVFVYFHIDHKQIFINAQNLSQIGWFQMVFTNFHETTDVCWVFFFGWIFYHTQNSSFLHLNSHVYAFYVQLNSFFLWTSRGIDHNAEWARLQYAYFECGHLDLSFVGSLNYIVHNQTFSHLWAGGTSPYTDCCCGHTDSGLSGLSYV